MDSKENAEQTLINLEKRMLLPKVRKSPAALDSLLAEDFTEIGRSGTFYSRQMILEFLEAEANEGSEPIARVLKFPIRLALERIGAFDLFTCQKRFRNRITAGLTQKFHLEERKCWLENRIPSGDADRALKL